MTTRQTIINSANKSFKYIKTGKYLFMMLFFTQLLFIIIAGSSSIFISLQSLDSVQSIPQITPEMATGEDVLSMLGSSADIYQEVYKTTVIPTITILIALAIIYILLNGINWDLTNMVITKKCKCIFYLIRFVLLAIVFLLPFYLLSWIIISSLPIQLILGIIPILSILILVTFYFMHISFSLIDQWKEIKNIKEILKKTFRLGTKNAKLLIPTYIFALFSLIVTFALLFAAREAPFLLLFAACLLFVLTINWARLYFLVTMRELI